MERERYFNAIEFKDIKGIIYNSAKQYAKNTAFILKHKEEKKITIEADADNLKGEKPLVLVDGWTRY